MTIKNIRENYDLPFLVRGMSVHVRHGADKWGWGVVVGATVNMLKVKLNDCLYAIDCYPRSNITYYDSTSGDIIAKFQ